MLKDQLTVRFKIFRCSGQHNNNEKMKFPESSNSNVAPFVEIINVFTSFGRSKQLRQTLYYCVMDLILHVLPGKIFSSSILSQNDWAWRLPNPPFVASKFDLEKLAATQ